LLQPATTYYYRLVADNAIGSPQLGNIVSFTTGSLATPVVPTPSAGPQLLNGSVKAKLKIKKRAKLPATTTIGQTVTWRSAKPKVCKVKALTVTAKRRGKCVLTAAAPATTGALAFTGSYRITIK